VDQRGRRSGAQYRKLNKCKWSLCTSMHFCARCIILSYTRCNSAVSILRISVRKFSFRSSTKNRPVSNRLLVGFALSQATKALRESRGIALLYLLPPGDNPIAVNKYYYIIILDLCTRRGWGVSVTPWQHLTPGKDPVPIVQEAGWASGLVWTGVENLAPPGFDPWTGQPVGSRYTDYATRPTSNHLLRACI